MAGERIRLEVKDRESRGSAETRRLRRQGLVPGVLYGRGKTPHAFCVDQRDLRRALSGPSGLHAILDVVLEGQKAEHHAILKDFQQDPLRGGVTHVDLHEVRLDQPIQTAVAVQLVGESPGVKEGGVLTQVTREVHIEALPTSIPEHLEADVSSLGIGDALRLADLTAPAEVTFLDDPEETVLATVAAPRAEIEEEVEEVEEGAEEAPIAEAAEAAEATEGGERAEAESGES